MMIGIFDVTGSFAEDKDAAKSLRTGSIGPTLDDGGSLVIDFGGVELTTQSFVHALISNEIRTRGEEILDKIEFLNCAPAVQGIIETVVQYSLDSAEIV